MSFVLNRQWLPRKVLDGLLATGILVSVAQAKDNKPATGTADTVTNTFVATEDSFDLQSHPFKKSLDWNANDPLFQLAHAHADQCALSDPDRTYIFHVASWQNNPSKYVLVSSKWYVYKLKGNVLTETHFKASGDPELYGIKRALIVGINSFGTSCGALKVTYKTSAKQGTPENVQALGQLASSILGLSTAKSRAISPSCKMLVAAGCQEGTQRLPFDLTVAVSASADVPAPDQPKTTPPESQPEDPTRPPDTAPPSNSSFPPAPNDGRSFLVVNDHQDAIAPSAPTLIALVSATSDTGTGRSSQAGHSTKPAKQDSAQQPTDTSGSSNKQQTPGTADCSDVENKKPCNFVRTFTSDDKEWWDVGIGVTIPGVKESKYSIVNSALKKSTTTHTDLYAIFDIYPFAKWVSKETKIPHLTAGLPVTGQTFYRPYFGAAENITTWTKLEKLGFPVRMSFFAGIVYMRTSFVQGSPTTADQLTADLKPERVLKPMIGVEVPVSALINKIGKKSSSNNNGSNAKQPQQNGSPGG